EFRMLSLPRVSLCLFILIGAPFTSSSQERPTWTASPGNVYQSNKAYPSPVVVKLLSNTCTYDSSGNVINRLNASDNYTAQVTGIGVTVSVVSVGDCSLTTSVVIGATAQPGFQMMTVKKGTVDDGFAHFDLMDATAGPIPSTPQVDVLWDVLTDHLCKDNFGNHMPSDLYCIETKIGNNSGHPLQLVGIGFYRPGPQCQVGTAPKVPCLSDNNGGIS